LVCSEAIEQGTQARHMTGRWTDLFGEEIETHYYVHLACAK
jgi:hypothetical protein